MIVNIKAAGCIINKIDTNFWNNYGKQRLYFTCYTNKGEKAGSNKYPFSGFVDKEGIHAKNFDIEVEGWKALTEILIPAFEKRNNSIIDTRPDWLKSKEDNDY